MERIVCILIGYIFGLFQTGYLYGRMNHVDIRKMGSGNAGSTNALRTLGVKAGVCTLLAALTNLWITLIALVVFVTIVAVTKYVSVGSIAVVLIFFAGVVFRGQTGSYGMESVYLYEMYAVAGFLALLAIWKHRANIQRLMNGTENKISFGKKK